MLKTFYATIGMVLAFTAIGHVVPARAVDKLTAPKVRRILYNDDGDSCMCLKKNIKGPAVVTAADLKSIVEDIAYPGSQGDTLLLCMNAQSTYYPSKVGSMRGTLATVEERKQWNNPREEQRFRNIEAMFAQGVDPYALLLGEAKKHGLEALITYRMNDAHSGACLRTRFYLEHPEYHMGFALDFGHEAVRDYTFRIIEEEVQRYDCDGIEMDFNRFPKFFQAGAEAERIAKINGLVQRVRQMLDTEGKKRGRRLVLAARVPTSYPECRTIGLDPVVWAKEGWIDFLTVSEFLVVRYDLPIAPWKKLISTIPVYGSIEVINADRSGPRLGNLSPDEYRRAARHVWADGADGIYLFNFFCPRDEGDKAFEPPFEVLNELGDPKALRGT
jgi:hypothetical protein